MALALGITSLVQTKRLQQRDRKERLLNEIIGWAEDVKRCGWGVEYSIPCDTTNIDIELLHLQMSANRFSRFMVPNTEAKYVTKIALVFGEPLVLTVRSAQEQLDNYVAHLKKTLSLNATEMQEQSKTLEEYEKALYDSIYNVMEEAIKIKTRGIS